MAWERQKKLKQKPIPKIEYIEGLARGINNIRTRALFSLTYLTAGRINEVISLQLKQVVKTHEDGKELILIENMKNQKNQKRIFKNIPIVIDDNRELCDFVLEYLRIINVHPEDRIFKFGVRRAEQLLAESVNMNPHYLRHVRLTHLAQYKDFTHIRLMKYAGWTSPQMADTYVQMSWKDLI